SNYSVYPQYDFQSSRRITGYSVSADLSIRVRDLDKINDAIDAATEGGANQVGGISLGVNEDKSKELGREARIKAIDEARLKAQELASLAGMTLGRVIDVQENSPALPRPFMYDAVALKAEGAGGDTQIEAGSTDITSTITLYYETH
ncbi:MAG: SIMPL domain-containing protein, partial [Patescibacteria group bacterium]